MADKDYITRDSGVKCITSIGNMVGSLYDRIADIRRLLQELEPSNVVSRDCYDRLLAENDRLRKERPVTHGYWKRERNGFPYCSVCDAVSPYEDMYGENIIRPQYCHVCGSVMDMKGAESDE